jgi:hypothetical protein
VQVKSSLLANHSAGALRTTVLTADGGVPVNGVARKEAEMGHILLFVAMLAVLLQVISGRKPVS